MSDEDNTTMWAIFIGVLYESAMSRQVDSYILNNVTVLSWNVGRLNNLLKQTRILSHFAKLKSEIALL